MNYSDANCSTFLQHIVEEVVKMAADACATTDASVALAGRDHAAPKVNPTPTSHVPDMYLESRFARFLHNVADR